MSKYIALGLVLVALVACQSDNPNAGAGPSPLYEDLPQWNCGTMPSSTIGGNYSAGICETPEGLTCLIVQGYGGRFAVSCDWSEYGQ